MHFNKFPFCLGFAFLSLFALSACGGDSSNGGDTPEKVEFVSSFDKLPGCTDDFEGDTVYVKDKKSDYICEDGEWVNIDSLDEPAKSSGSEASSSESEEDEDSSSSASPVDRTIKGVTQKGPFVKGSKVTVMELESGRNLDQTGSAFLATIQDNDGKFILNARSMVSQYVELQAEGFYRNEVTGKKSNASLTLYALTDVTLRKGGAVNVNLLTHLEYYRVRYLVKKEKMKMSEAKEQAKNEILKAFNIEGNFESSEDMDIFSEGDGNAALLAISVLMQHDLEVADLTELLTAFASDIEEDGKWDEAEAAKYKAEMADWVSGQDVSDGMATIRENIEKWNLGKVPEFEKYARNFWYLNYGLGECTKNKNGNVLSANNELSANYGKQIRYICKDGAWIEASDTEKDTYQWPTGEDGDVRYGSINKDLCYMYKKDAWVPTDGQNCFLELYACTEEKQGAIEKVDGNYYTCDQKSWRDANDYEKDIYRWGVGFDGEIKQGNISEKKYKYDELQSKWVLATASDVSLGIQGCTTKRLGEISQSIRNGEYYVCKNMDWFVATKIDYDTQGSVCDENNIGAFTVGIETHNAYYCSSAGWSFLPETWDWNVPAKARLNPEKSYGTLIDTRDNKEYKTIQIGTQTWMAENLNYKVDNSWCYQNKESNCLASGRYYSWAVAIGRTDAECGPGKICNLSDDKVQGVCPEGWHLPKLSEWQTLINTVGYSCDGSYCEGVSEVLNSKTGWDLFEGYENVDNPNGTDDYGFSALPTGFRNEYGDYNPFEREGYIIAYFWSSTEDDESSANGLYLYNRDAYLGWTDKEDAFTVRCLKD